MSSIPSQSCDNRSIPGPAATTFINKSPPPRVSGIRTVHYSASTPPTAAIKLYSRRLQDAPQREVGLRPGQRPRP